MPDISQPDGSEPMFSGWMTSICTCCYTVRHTEQASEIRSSWHNLPGTYSAYPYRKHRSAGCGKESVATTDARLLSGYPEFQQQKLSVPMLLLLSQPVCYLRRNAILRRAPDWSVRRSVQSLHERALSPRYILLPNSDTPERKEHLRSPHLRHVPGAVALPSTRHPRWKQTAPNR